MENYQTDFISIETPRIRKFYEKHVKKEHETPNPQINNFLQLLTSPVDGHPLAKLQYLTVRHQDLIINHLENSMSALKTRKLLEYGIINHGESSNKGIDALPKFDFEGLLFDWDKPNKKLNFSQDHGDSFRDGALSKKNHKSNLHDYKATPNEQNRSLRDITSQMNNNNKSTNKIVTEVEECENTTNKGREGALEVRKRKRKSNQQLKILQAEFERDEFWGKDKILNMARITGLSESQVYKWCWDQKKKKETDSRQDESKFTEVRSDSSHEKENISPIEKMSGLNKHSKHIFKTKNSSNFNGLSGKSIEKYRLKKYHKLRYESTVPKRIDFSLE